MGAQIQGFVAIAPLILYVFPICSLAYACVKMAWLAARVPLQLARMPRGPRPAWVRRSRRQHATLAAAPVLFAHAFGPCHMEKTYGISGNTSLRETPGAVACDVGPPARTTRMQQRQAFERRPAYRLRVSGFVLPL